MATLKVYKKPEDFRLPQTYERKPYEGGYSFIKKVQSEIETFEKYTIGRYFDKTFKITKPTEDGLEETEVSRPVCTICQVYIPTDTENKTIFVVGSDSDMLNFEILDFSNNIMLNADEINMETLEKKSFSSGVVKLVGHEYNKSNDTVNFKVKKIDGTPFRSQDPDFVSCDIAPKEALQVMLTTPGNPIFFVYCDGKITRRGREEATSSEFQLLYTVYNIIKQLTSQ